MTLRMRGRMMVCPRVEEDVIRLDWDTIRVQSIFLTCPDTFYPLSLSRVRNTFSLPIVMITLSMKGRGLSSDGGTEVGGVVEQLNELVEVNIGSVVQTVGPLSEMIQSAIVSRQIQLLEWWWGKMMESERGEGRLYLSKFGMFLEGG
jgi:hypothetical protein